MRRHPAFFRVRFSNWFINLNLKSIRNINETKRRLINIKNIITEILNENLVSDGVQENFRETLSTIYWELEGLETEKQIHRNIIRSYQLQTIPSY